MAKTIALLILVMMNVAAVAQSSYTVIYRHLVNVDSTGRNLGSELKGALYVMGDTMTVYRLAWKEKELMQKLDLNSGAAHHGTINNMKGDYFYSIGHNKDSGYFIKDPRDTATWEIFPNDTMTILNKKCVAAKNAGVIAWYAPSMPLKAGPMSYFGPPGLVLGVFDSRYNYVCTAEKIIPSVPEIVTTGKPVYLTMDEFREMQKRNTQKAEKKGIRWFGL